MMTTCYISYRFLQEADMVIYMQDGRVHSCGSPAEVLPLVEAREVSPGEEASGGENIRRVSSNSNEEPTSDVSLVVYSNDIVRIRTL